MEQAIADGYGFYDDGNPAPVSEKYRGGQCPEPGSKRHDPYAKRSQTHD